MTVGYLGSSVRETQGTDGLAVIVGIRFASADRLLAWEASEARRHRLEEGTALTVGGVACALPRKIDSMPSSTSHSARSG